MFALAPVLKARRNPVDASSRRNHMRRIILTTVGLLAFGTAGALAQTVPPVPNASGSQATNPGSYGNTKPQ
jgi:hypothetical protein